MLHIFAAKIHIFFWYKQMKVGIFWEFLWNSAQQIDTLHAQRANDIETQNMAFSYTFPTIYNYNQPPFVGGRLLPRVMCNSYACGEKSK